ncbi:MAG: desulfoferrodoxin family protein [Candidatus Cryptobacteroides sp.]
MELKIYRCRHCGNIVIHLHSSGVPVVCCGEKMEKLVPNTTDASLEKHVPEVSHLADLVKVSVGSVLHPMTEEHHIEWIALASEEGVQIKWLKPGDAPIAEFRLTDKESIVDVYEYCNLHGLWKKEVFTV